MSELKYLGTRDAYGEVLVELGEKNKDVVVLDADLSQSTKTILFARKFPDRFFNVGVAEQNMIGISAGLSAGGKIPFASTFAIFGSGRVWEQIRQSVAYPKLNVKIVTTHGGITVGPDGASHQCTEDLSLIRTIPKMTVIVPADAVETKKVIYKVVDYNGPVYIRLSREKFPVIFDNGYNFEIGKGTVVKDGSDVTIIAIGIMVFQAIEAHKMLMEDDISARVINMSTIKPIDRELILKSAKETGAIVTAEEHSVIGGLGSAVAEILVENFPVPMSMVGIRDSFGTSGNAQELMEYFGLTAKSIVSAVKTVIKRKMA